MKLHLILPHTSSSSLISTLAAVAPMTLSERQLPKTGVHVKSKCIVLKLRGQPQLAVRHHLKNSCHFFRALEKFQHVSIIGTYPFG
jgi:hypothetical protein